MKFLIIRLGSIGDVVLTTPVIRCVKKQVSNSVVHYLVKPEIKNVIEHNPYIDKIHLFQNDAENLEELKSETFDHIIDLQNDAGTKKLCKILKVSVSSYNKLNFEKSVFINLKWNIMPKQLHVVDRYMQAVDYLGVYNDGKGLDYFIPKKDETRESDIPASHHLGYIVIVIGASFYTKKLPVKKLQELCKKIDHPIILLGSKKEFGEGDAIASVDPIKVYNACGKFNLNESADLVRKSKIVITHDTGLMHIAAAFKKPIIIVWGSTTPSFGMTPYYGDTYRAGKMPFYNNVQVKKLWCRPCTEIGKTECPLGHFKCMKKISIDEILQKVDEKIRNNTNSLPHSFNS
jgi:heptosyltransferase-2